MHRRIQGVRTPLFLSTIAGRWPLMSKGDEGIAQKQYKLKLVAYYVRIP